MPEPVLSVRDLSIAYQARRGYVQAVRNISFDVERGEAVALIGESGSGKTTVGLGLMHLLPTAAKVLGGSVKYHRHANGLEPAQREIEVLGLKGANLRQFRWHECAMVFQSALNALNPVLRISEHFIDTAKAHGYLSGYQQTAALQERSFKLLSMVRLDQQRVWHSFPHELSGGMRQRVLIALALLLEPQLLILDEPTTALDILTQRNIMDVLKELRSQLGFAMLFISHDLALAAELADRVATVYAGEIIEIGDVRTIFSRPYHPYTIGLIQAMPTLTGDNNDLVSIPGSPPDLIQLPTGCKFHPRCPLADERCRLEETKLTEVESGHKVACWHWTKAREVLKTYKV
ncbi:MAG: ABC transporter ATP-binding protein [Chloroflexota bacterium]